jgi:hypothetical protein
MSEPIEVQAHRRGRTWTASIPDHGIYGHGRTLQKLHQNLVQGLALAGVTQEITIIPVTPELETLRAHRAAADIALEHAVAALALRRTTIRDIATATGAPIKQVKALLPPAPSAEAAE